MLFSTHVQIRDDKSRKNNNKMARISVACSIASALTTMPEKKAVLTKRMSKKRAETEGKYGKWNGGAERDA